MHYTPFNFLTFRSKKVMDLLVSIIFVFKKNLAVIHSYIVLSCKLTFCHQFRPFHQENKTHFCT